MARRWDWVGNSSHGWQNWDSQWTNTTSVDMATYFPVAMSSESVSPEPRTTKPETALDWLRRRTEEVTALAV